VGSGANAVIPSEHSEPSVIPSERSESRDLHFVVAKCRSLDFARDDNEVQIPRLRSG